MANLKPWYKVVTPREDLREGKPLDASEFAVHLDQVRDGHAPSVYQDPKQFFERTFLTQNLCGLAAEGSLLKKKGNVELLVIAADTGVCLPTFALSSALKLNRAGRPPSTWSACCRVGVNPVGVSC